MYHIFGTTLLNGLVSIFFSIFYTSLHFINYGYFHINNVHELHHQFPRTNLAPDYYDIVFNTKNKFNDKVENMDHHTINIIVVTIMMLFIKKLYSYDTYKPILKSLLNTVLFGGSAVGFIIAIYLYYFTNTKFIS